MLNDLAAVLPLPKQHTTRTSGRQVVVVDIENLVGGAVLTEASARWARTQLETVMAIEEGAHVIVGTSHIGLFHSATAWPGKQYRVNSGPDGADLVLIEELEALRVNRYDEVILASGDGLFTEAVSRLTARGGHVTVVAHRSQCSARLRMAAHQTVYLQTEHNADTAGGVV